MGNSLFIGESQIRTMLYDQANKTFHRHTTERQVNALMGRILNQSIFKYDYSNIPKYFFKCFCLRKQEIVREKSKDDFYLDKGMKRLDRDMDVVEWVRMLHKVEIMNSILFTEFQQLLLQFQHKLVLDSDTTDSE